MKTTPAITLAPPPARIPRLWGTRCAQCAHPAIYQHRPDGAERAIPLCSPHYWRAHWLQWLARPLEAVNVNALDDDMRSSGVMVPRDVVERFVTVCRAKHVQPFRGLSWYGATGQCPTLRTAP